MNWTKLLFDFFNGDPDAIEAVCAVITTLIAIPGVTALFMTFKTQKRINSDQIKINEQQLELNRLALESDRRTIRPEFKIDYDEELGHLRLTLENATAYNLLGRHRNSHSLTFTPNEFMYRTFSKNQTITIVVGFDLIGNEFYDDKPAYELTYLDEAKRPYRQLIFYTGDAAWLGVPELVES